MLSFLITDLHSENWAVVLDGEIEMTINGCIHFIKTYASLHQVI